MAAKSVPNIFDIYVSSRFLNGELESSSWTCVNEKIYRKSDEQKVCKLNKAICRLKEATAA